LKRINIFLTCLLVYSITSVSAEGLAAVDETNQKIMLVNSNDTVYFDLGNSIISGSYTDIPISFAADDTVYAFDFAIKYDYTIVEFDSLIVTGSNLQYLYYYNYSDSTLRFTSNSLTQLPQGTPVLYLRFNTYGIQLCPGSFDESQAWLNGDVCTSKLKGCTPVGISEYLSLKTFKLFPNPAVSYVEIVAPFDGNLNLINTEGKQVFAQHVAEGENIIRLPEQLRAGCYFVLLSGTGQAEKSRLVIVK